MLILPGHLTLAQLRQLHTHITPLALDAAARPGIRAAADLVHQAAQGGAAVYGVNTGFGKLANQRIAQADLETLQLNLLRSHAVGVGEPMSEPVVRLILLMKAASLARGYSGIRELVIDRLFAFYNLGITPVIPAQGSVGASGDLAPLAHLCLPLIGEGEVFYGGTRMPAAKALHLAKLEPIQLWAKEGLALINGTQVSTALAIDALFATERLFEAAVISGAVTLDAARGSDGPFDPRIHAVRGQPGQIAIDARAAGLGVLQFLQRQHGGTFAHDEAVAIGVERTRGVFGIVVAGAQGSHRAEAADADGDDCRFRAAGEHHVGVAHFDRAPGLAEGVVGGGAGGAGGEVRSA